MIFLLLIISITPSSALSAPGDYKIVQIGDTQHNFDRVNAISVREVMLPYLKRVFDVAYADPEVEAIFVVGDLTETSAAAEIREFLCLAIGPRTSQKCPDILSYSSANQILDSSKGMDPHQKLVVIISGNHDSEATYLENFGPNFWYGTLGYVESSPSGLSHAWVHPLGGTEHLILGLRCDYDTADRSWALGLFNKYPGIPVILVTHILTTSGGAHTTNSPVGPYCAESNNSDIIWNTFVVPYSSRIILALSGHYADAIRGGYKALQTVSSFHVLDSMVNNQYETTQQNGCAEIIWVKPNQRLIKAEYVNLVDGHTPVYCDRIEDGDQALPLAGQVHLDETIFNFWRSISGGNTVCNFCEGD